MTSKGETASFKTFRMLRTARLERVAVDIKLEIFCSLRVLLYAYAHKEWKHGMAQKGSCPGGTFSTWKAQHVHESKKT